MSFFQPALKTSPYLRILINIGCRLDVPMGSPVLGTHGAYYTNGGHNGCIVILGPGNSYKSALADHFNEQACYRISPMSSGQKYDTENNVYIPGLERRLKRIDPKADWFDTGRWIATDNTLYTGDEWFKNFKDYSEAKIKEGAKLRFPTPLLNKDGSVIKSILPTFSTMDSISKFEVSKTLETRDKTSIGDSGQNMINAHSGLYKKNMIDELPRELAKSNSYMTMTVHYGELKQFDPYAPVRKQLHLLGAGMKLKGVPENITFLSTAMLLVDGISKLANNSDKKLIEYPLQGAGNDNDVNDLNILKVLQVRCKTGPSGYHVPIVVSQKYGVLENLTDFHFLRMHKGYGLGGDMSLTGNFKKSWNVLMPEVFIARTTVRTLMDKNPRLSRAMSICADLLQMSQFWREHLMENDARLLDYTTNPEKLYNDIKDKGYDWDMLLNTRYWWTLDEEAYGQMYLCTLDIMRMALGTYHPYWLEDDKKTIKKKYQKIIDAHAVIENIDEDTGEVTVSEEKEAVEAA